ncbi:hypothetical protein [Okeania sp. KiyG1]|uniref:hypothetical protein n=1 Tax=Okeania sp. KiyG1 TaxID=2720165 RepID=UPI00192338D8|nr:hypothetical protein [Okeania sp. KiyG1]
MTLSSLILVMFARLEFYQKRIQLGNCRQPTKLNLEIIEVTHKLQLHSKLHRTS